MGKRSILLLSTWISAALASSALCIAAWTMHAEGFVRVLANSAYVAAIPVWIPVHLLGLRGVRDNPIAIVIVNAIAWMGWIGLALLFLTLRKALIHRPRAETVPAEADFPQSPPDSGRRAFLCNAAFGVAAIGAVATPGYATLVEPWSIKVRRYTIPINDLPNALNGITLVQLSDTHLGPRIPAAFVEQAVGLVIAQNPDLVLLTGDHVHDGTGEIDRAVEVCGPLLAHARIGVVGVLGNHDWWGDGPRLSRQLRGLGIHMIDNDRVWIDPWTRSITTSEPGDESLALVGLGDLDEDVIDPRRAFRGVAAATPRIVLAHNPDTAELGSLTRPGSPRVDLMCSGHTHGGQVRIPILGTPMVPSSYGSKYAGGLVLGPAFPVLVSRGVGMSLLPVRIGVPPEISVITLTRP